MRVVDPDRVVNQPAEFRIAGSGLEMHQQSVPRRPSATRDGVEGSGGCRMQMCLPRCGGERLILWRGLTVRRRRHRGQDRRLRRQRLGWPLHATSGRLGVCFARFMTRGESREQGRWYALVTATWHGETLLAAGTAINERPQEREVVCEIFEDPLEVSFKADHSRPCLFILPITPLAKLARHGFLHRFAIGEVRRATRAASDEIVLAQRETRGQVRRF
jgi:hypothetical protein